jgi:FKBP-type peptidyl-prolyl cis-trans isomerase
MKFYCQNFLFLAFIAEAFSSSKECTGKNLPPDENLRIGIKHRPAVCDRKSKKGDMLLMHYEGKLYSDCSEFDSSRTRDS